MKYDPHNNHEISYDSKVAQEKYYNPFDANVIKVNPVAYSLASTLTNNFNSGLWPRDIMIKVEPILKLNTVDRMDMESVPFDKMKSGTNLIYSLALPPFPSFIPILVASAPSITFQDIV